jgi:two-component system CitB family sensor kinase
VRDFRLYITVADSGDGLQTQDPEAPFTEGYSTSPAADPPELARATNDQEFGQGEGLGLALSRQIARSCGGDVWVV